MAPRSRKAPAKKDTTVYKVRVSGKAYSSGVEDRFDVPVSGRRNTALGFYVWYQIGIDDLRRLADIMADMATPEDESLYDESVAAAVYRDFDNFPPEAGVR